MRSVKYLPIVFLFLAIAAFGANYCVKFHKDHEWLPDGYPGAITNVGESAKILAGWHTNWTAAQLAERMELMRPAFEVALSNQNWIADAPLRDKTNELQTLFKSLDSFDKFCARSNPTAAQVSVQLQDLNKTLLRLRPILQELYEKDPR